MFKALIGAALVFFALTFVSPIVSAIWSGATEQVSLSSIFDGFNILKHLPVGLAGGALWFYIALKVAKAVLSVIVTIALLALGAYLLITHTDILALIS